MKTVHLRLLPLFLVPLLVATAGAVELQFQPHNGRFDVDQDIVLSVVTHDSLEVRTIELIITYDPLILVSLDGVPGDLFWDSGCLIFEDFVNDIPGECYGAAVTIGYDCWVSGIGELFRFNFYTLAEGMSVINVEMIRLYSPDGLVIEDVHLPWTVVYVGPTTDLPYGGAESSTLRLDRNPFRPASGSAEIFLDLPHDQSVDLAVYDLSGRRVRELLTRVESRSGPATTVRWDGKDDAGGNLPTGIYFYSLRTAEFRESRKVVLLR